VTAPGNQGNCQKVSNHPDIHVRVPDLDREQSAAGVKSFENRIPGRPCHPPVREWVKGMGAWWFPHTTYPTCCQIQHFRANPTRTSWSHNLAGSPSPEAVAKPPDNWHAAV